MRDQGKAKEQSIEGLQELRQGLSQGETTPSKANLDTLLLDSLPHPTMIARRDRIVLAANKVAKELGAKVGGYCWQDFAHCRFIPEEDLRYIRENGGEPPPGGTHCTFCLADKAFSEGRAVHKPDVWAFDRIWDIWWIPLDGQRFLHYTIDLTDQKLMEKALRESEKDLNRAQAVAHTGSWRLDVRKNELLWSDETYRIFGIPKGTPLTYETFLAAVHSEDREYLGLKWSAALRGEPYDVEHRILIADSVKWVRERAELEFDEQGTLLGGFGTVQDITERKATEKALKDSETRYRSLFENMLDGFAYCKMLFDEEGRPEDFVYLHVNKAFGRLTGLENVIGKRVTELIPGIKESHPELFEIYSGVALTGKPKRFEIFLKPLQMWLSISVYSPKKDHFVAVFDNISERKQMEEELRKSRDELELRVQERTRELERSNQALQDFASVASHDLQEPLRKISKFSDLVCMKHSSSLDDEAKDYLKRTQGGVKRMEALLDALLEYSRVTTRANPFIATDLTILAEDVISDLEVLIEQKGATVKLDKLPVAEADPTQFMQLLQNLISNGLKYNKSEKPEVKVYAEILKDGYCRIYVEDNGIGFDEQHLNRIFQPFQRLHGRSSEYKGTGMGLAICKRIVERHGGNITAKSKTGQGSIFIVQLPLRQPHT